MGLLDDAIREHLDLKRRHGASESEVARQEAEALGPVLREEGEEQESGSAPPAAAEVGLSLPYDRAAEAGLTGEPDLPSFEWHGSSTAEPEVPSFVPPEPVRSTEPEPDGVESRADGELASGAADSFDVVEADLPLEEPEVAVEPGVPETEGPAQEDRSVEVSPEPPVTPEPREEAAAPEPSPTPEGPVSPEPPVDPEPPLSPESAISPVPPEPAAAPEPEDSFGPEPPTADPGPPEPAVSFGPEPGAELGGSVEPPAEAAFPDEHPIESTVPTEAEGGLAEAQPLEDDATAFHPAVGAPEPAHADVEDLPPEPDPVPPEGGSMPLEAEDLPPEQEPPPPTAGEFVERPPSDLGPDEPPIDERPDPSVEEPFVAGEEEAWREAGEGPADISNPLPEPPLGGASSSEDPLDTPVEPPLPADAEAARGFFDETAEYERPRPQERSRAADPDFED